MVSGPLPGTGEPGYIELAGYALRYVIGSYQVQEAERFGQKQSVGSLKYADFNPYESAHNIETLTSGYGLRRYSDLIGDDQETRASGYYKESSNIDARENPIILSPALTTETLTGSTGNVVWLGEFTHGGTTDWVAVAGTKVYKRNSDGTWTLGLTLAAAAVKGGVGVFGGNLIFCEGAAHAIEYTTDLASVTGKVKTDGVGPPDMFGFAFTADHASAYIAGGEAATDTNLVWSSLTGLSFLTASKTTCGSNQNAINALAPGGGIALVLVGKTTELGEIDNAGLYRNLVPYDSILSTNSQGLRWWMSSGGEDQRGPIIAVFPRDRSAWTYQPTTQIAGTAQDIAPWAVPGIRPPNARGIPTAFQGGARWLYYAIKNGAGSAWLIARDARTGANHTLLDLGAYACDAIGITSKFGTTPMLFMGKAGNIYSAILPLDGESPLDNSTSTYALTGTLDLPDIDLGFPDEDKVLFSVRLVAAGLSAGAQRIRVLYATDGSSTYAQLGLLDSGTSTEMLFPSNLVVKRLSLRFMLTTTVATTTPQLVGASIRMALNTRVYRIWSLEALVPGGSSALVSDDLNNPKTLIDDLWAARRAGVPVTFKDRWGDSYQVRLYKMAELENAKEVGAVPETHVLLQLLEISSTPDDPVTLTVSAPVASSALLPMTLGS